jgi:hypothetical protein
VALCQARSSTKPLWGFSSSNPYHSQSRAEHWQWLYIWTLQANLLLVGVSDRRLGSGFFVHVYSHASVVGPSGYRKIFEF